jgi:hypothetical protein
MLSAEKEWANATVSETLVRGSEDFQIHVHSVVLYCQGTDPDDQVQVSAAFPSGGYTQIALCTQHAIGGGTVNHEVNVYPDLLLPVGAGLHVAGIVTGIGEYAGAFVIYSLVPVSREEPEPVSMAAVVRHAERTVYPWSGLGIPCLG